MSLSIEKVVAEEDGKWAIAEAAKRFYGTWTNALIKNGVQPTEKVNIGERELLLEFYRMKSEGIELKIANFPKWVQYAVYKLYGGWKNAKKEIGLSNKFSDFAALESRIKMVGGFVLYSKQEIDAKVYELLRVEREKGSSNIHAKLIEEFDENLLISIKTAYRSTTEYFSQLDLDYYAKPYVPFKWTANNIKRQLMRWIREGYPVNYTAIQSKHKGIIEASRKIFGNYEKAFDYAGLNYEDFRVDTSMASFYGHEFENIIGDILTDLGVQYKRHAYINGCHPDFVIGKHWIDAKLSEWTISFSDCSTIHKYLPHCRRLSIIYLRQMKKETYYSNELGVDMIHVSELLKELPEQRAIYYNGKLNHILDKLAENAA